MKEVSGLKIDGCMHQVSKIDRYSCTRQFWAAGACTRQFSSLILHSNFSVPLFLLVGKSCTRQLKSLTRGLLYKHNATKCRLKIVKNGHSAIWTTHSFSQAKRGHSSWEKKEYQILATYLYSGANLLCFYFNIWRVPLQSYPNNGWSCHSIFTL